MAWPAAEVNVRHGALTTGSGGTLGVSNATYQVASVRTMFRLLGGVLRMDRIGIGRACLRGRSSLCLFPQCRLGRLLKIG